MATLACSLAAASVSPTCPLGLPSRIPCVPIEEAYVDMMLCRKAHIGSAAEKSQYMSADTEEIDAVSAGRLMKKYQSHLDDLKHQREVVAGLERTQKQVRSLADEAQTALDRMRQAATQTSPWMQDEEASLAEMCREVNVHTNMLYKKWCAGSQKSKDAALARIDVLERWLDPVRKMLVQAATEAGHEAATTNSS